jgi:hypothetical protein
MESPVSDWSALLEDLDVSLLIPQPAIVEEILDSPQNDTFIDSPRNTLLHQRNCYSPGTENWFIRR